MPDVGKPLCPGEAGIIAGILDKTLGGSHCVKRDKVLGHRI
jgi:predicted hydrocarbon binding protein